MYDWIQSSNLTLSWIQVKLQQFLYSAIQLFGKGKLRRKTFTKNQPMCCSLAFDKILLNPKATWNKSRNRIWQFDWFPTLHSNRLFCLLLLLQCILRLLLTYSPFIVSNLNMFYIGTIKRFLPKQIALFQDKFRSYLPAAVNVLLTS